jgi:serine/threonine protein phosphatase PrpC
MSIDIHEEAGIHPCSSCQSPVFDDESYCEACGTLTVEASAIDAAGRTRIGDRHELDLGAIAGVTDRGHRRHRNEDAMAVATVNGRSIAVVCDGVGSTANPDQAARAAADTVLDVLAPILSAPEWPDDVALERLFREAFLEALRAVLRVSGDEPGGHELSPSTTLVAAVATPQRIVVGNVGDSRAYWLGSASSQVLTIDDSWAQENIAGGTAPEVAYADREAHTITRWIGADSDSVEPSMSTFGVTEPGALVVCSDGLWNYFDEPERLNQLIPRGTTPSPIETARRLADAALDAGGGDNVTVVVAPLGVPVPARESSIPRSS